MSILPRTLEYGDGSGVKQSDNESVKTEDFASKFNQISSFPESGQAHSSSLGKRSLYDAESVRTEDFAKEFRKTLQSAPYNRGSTVPSIIGANSLTGAGSGGGYRPYTSSAAFRNPTGPMLIRDDSESMRTEDFENKFRSMMVRSAPPVAAYDDSYLSSSDQNAKAALLRERVSNLFKVAPSRVRLDDASQSDVDTEVEHRYQELLARRAREREARMHSAPPPPRRVSPPRMMTMSATRMSNSPTRGDTRARRISPIREKPYYSDTEDNLTIGEDEFSNEVKHQSRLIQKELEMERRKRLQQLRERSNSPLRHKPGMTPRETFDKKVVELDDLNFQVRKALQEKDAIVEELNFAEDSLRKHKAEVRLAEKLAKDNKSKAEDTKTEMVLAEMKRDTAARELQTLTEELNKKKTLLQELEENLKMRMREFQDLESIGIAKEEIENILAERDELYQLIKQNEDAEYQRYELEKRLSQANEEMAKQAHQSQAKLIALEEEIELCLTKIADTTEERNALKIRINDMESKFKGFAATIDDLEEANRRLARAKDVSDREKLEEIERLKLRMQGDLSHIQRRTEDEEESFKRQIQQLKDNLEAVQKELQTKDDAACIMKEQLARTETELSRANESRSLMMADTAQQLAKIERESDKKVDSIRVEFQKEKDALYAQQQKLIDQERIKDRKKLEDSLVKQLQALEYQLQSREEEVQGLRDLLNSKEINWKSKEDEQRMEVREKVRVQVRQEKERWEKDSSEKWRRELTMLKEETEKAMEVLQEDNRRKTEVIKEFEQELEKVRQELNTEKEKVKVSTKDKIAAINRIKEVAKEETTKEIDKIRSQYEHVAIGEMDRLREQLKLAEDGLAVTKSEIEASVKREKELSVIVEKIEKLIIQEVNNECGKIAEVLGVTPRKVSWKEQVERVVSSSPTNSQRSGKGGATVNPVTSALANLQACGEEMRNYVGELKSQVDNQREKLHDFTKTKEGEIAGIKQELAEEKARDLQSLRERLIKEHMEEIARLAKQTEPSVEAQLKEKDQELRELKQNMKKWKEQTAERLALKLQDEFRREFERKLRDLKNSLKSKDQELNNQRKEMEKFEKESRAYYPQQKAPSIVFAAQAGDNPSKVISQLQDRVKVLREENLNLRKSAFNKKDQQQQQQQHAQSQQESVNHQSSHQLSASLSNLNKAGFGADDYVSQLESKIKALDERVKKAEKVNNQLNKDKLNAAIQMANQRTPTSGGSQSSTARPASRASFRDGAPK